MTVIWPICHNEPFISKKMRSKKTNYKLLLLEFLYPHSLLLWLMSDCYLLDIINGLFICFLHILLDTVFSVVFYYNYYLMLEIIFTLENNILFMLFSIFIEHKLRHESLKSKRKIPKQDAWNFETGSFIWKVAHEKINYCLNK